MGLHLTKQQKRFIILVNTIEKNIKSEKQRENTQFRHQSQNIFVISPRFEPSTYTVTALNIHFMTKTLQTILINSG